MEKKFNDIRELLIKSAERFPNNLAFRLKAGKAYDDITYTRLLEEVRAVGKYLIANDLIGKRIAVIGKNSYPWMLVYLAVLSAGGVIVPLDKGLMEFEIEDQIKRANVEVIFYASDFKEMLSGREDLRRVCTDDAEFYDIIEEGKTLSNDVEYDAIKIDNEAMSILLFTSGTTSKSKAVMLCHKNLMANVYGMSIWEKFYETDVNMAILPFHHTFGMVQVVLFLAYGMCNVFCEGLRFQKCMTEYKVSVLVGVPRIIEEVQATILRTLAKRGKSKTVKRAMKLTSLLNKIGIDIRRKVFSEILDALGGNLRVIIVGAAAAKPDCVEWFNKLGILTIQGYGLTETSPVLAAENDTHRKRGSVGPALPNVRVSIAEPDEKGIGEICAEGDNVMLGYYEDKEATEAVLKNGCFHTGDMGYIDSKGFIFITGRKKNVIVLRNGKNVFPEEIEALLDESDAIRECLVSNNMARDKEEIFAKIVYNTDYDEAKAKELIEAHIADVNSRLIAYKQIRSYEITDKEMEKTTTLKIKRYQN